MKNEKEMYEALLVGKRICDEMWPKESYIELNGEGAAVTHHGEPYHYWLVEPEHWKVWESPKKLKTDID